MRSHTFHEKAIKKEGVLEIFWVQTGAHMPWQSRSQVKSIKQEKEKKLFLRHRAEHVLVDHVAAGVSEPGPLFFLFDKRHERQFHVDTRDMAEHLLELDLLCVHEECIWDLCRAEFLALAAVHAGVRNVGKPDQVEHEAWRDLAGFHVDRVLRGAVDTVADRACRDTRVALDAPRGFGHDLL